MTSYAQCRENFRTSIRRAGGAASQYVLKGYAGPQGEELVTDIGTFGRRDASKVVVVSSGAHGVEGRLGFEMQCEWAESARQVCANGNDVRFVLVHALNPYGAAHGLRNDERNIDIMRNFVDSFQTQTTSDHYRKLAKAFAPRSAGRLALAGSWARMLSFAAVNGISAFKQALVGGQYAFPDGLYYGGDRPSSARERWAQIVETHVVNPSLRELWHIDIHTGEGPYGKLQVMAGEMGDNLVAECTESGLAVAKTAAVFSKLSGDIVDFWPQILPSECKVNALALEVGTSRSFIQGLDVLHNMIRRNALKTLYNDDHPRAKFIIQAMRDMFYPRDPEWGAEAGRQSSLLWDCVIRDVYSRQFLPAGVTQRLAAG